MLGHLLRLASGGTIDARVLWISLAVRDTQIQAETLRNELEAEGTWAWQRKELAKPGSGKGALSSTALGKAYAITFPATVSSASAITLSKQGEYEERSYTGEVVFDIGEDGAITITERVGIDDYLAGVLPSEMPALWPADALKAQAVAARSDVKTRATTLIHRLRRRRPPPRRRCRGRRNPWRGLERRYSTAPRRIQRNLRRLDRAQRDGLVCPR